MSAARRSAHRRLIAYLISARRRQISGALSSAAAHKLESVALVGGVAHENVARRKLKRPRRSAGLGGVMLSQQLSSARRGISAASSASLGGGVGASRHK